MSISHAPSKIGDALDTVPSAVDIACQRVAPTWPLDKSIAVNPWWEMRHLPMAEVAAKLQTLGQVRLLMPKPYYRALWQDQIEAVHLCAAAQDFGVQDKEAELLAYLEQPEPEAHWQHITDLLDRQPQHAHKMPWHDEVLQQISQFCALYFQYPEQMQHINDAKNGFYQAWLDVVRQDKGIEILMAEAGLSKQFADLPHEVDELFTHVLTHMLGDVSDGSLIADYTYALLLDIHGWASWLAYEAWQDAFDGKENHLLRQLLAIRLAWDWVLWQHHDRHHKQSFASVKQYFRQQLARVHFTENSLYRAQKNLWIWQRALEYSYQGPLQHQLLHSTTTHCETPVLQAIFCIDVRSEPMRRALEAQHPAIQTLGYAGFFGLPIEYSPTGGAVSRPQLPGLLKPAIRVAQASGNGNPLARQIAGQAAAKHGYEAAPSAFGMIEAKGLFKTLKLLGSSLHKGMNHPPSAPKEPASEWQLTRAGSALADSDLADLAMGILKGMGLTQGFAPTVLLIGHGSVSSNNPHAAGLNCGACGGQSGEVNANVLAQILNSQTVRSQLRLRGIQIPDATRFVAALHNTTTDELICYGLASHPPWQEWLTGATESAQAARAESIGITAKNPQAMAKAFHARTNDWAQLRPEWGLANNAAFIVAPRRLTQDLNLAGRAFLHDYDWQTDDHFGVLESIITAPMVVTNWINLQYYASVTDNVKYGSGNKLLHNVVGGGIGVFEGNGGDLRIGLALQSLHDGKEWRHQPVRLSVYLAAPREAIAGIVQTNKAIADLINNDWLFLFQWDVEQKQIWQLKNSQWSPAPDTSNAL